MIVDYNFRNHPLISLCRDISSRTFSNISDLDGVTHVRGANFSTVVNVGNVMLPKGFEVTLANRSVSSIGETDEIVRDRRIDRTSRSARR